MVVRLKNLLLSLVGVCCELNSTKYLMSCTLSLPKSITPLLTTKPDLCVTFYKKKEHFSRKS